MRYKADLEILFDLKASFIPYQSVSLYELLTPNIYDYQNQINVLRKAPDIVIAPAKVLMEKFPQGEFFESNGFELKVGDTISQNELLERLVNLGYKRATMVSDIGEFSIRGDISDIYTLNDKPIRVEFWGDEIVEIRFFDNESQKSIEKMGKVEVLPLYKFVLPTKPTLDLPHGLKNNLEQEAYFEGINVYQSYFNEDYVNILDYLKEYIIVYDEIVEVFSKISQQSS